MRDGHESRQGQRAASTGRIQFEGVSQKTVHDFCDAIEFAVHSQQPTEAETATLKRVLAQMSREAHASGITAERMLIGLKKAWTTVCMREPSPDVFDPLWDAIVRMSLDAYEATRPSR